MPTYKQRYDVSFRKVEDNKSYFVRIGAAFQDEKGNITVKLDAHPIGQWDGRLTLFPKAKPE